MHSYNFNEIDITNCSLYEWQNIIKPESELIVQASKMDGSDGITNTPIGMAFNYVHQKGQNIENQIGKHNELVLCSFNKNTDDCRRKNSIVNRKTISKTLEKNNIHNIEMESDKYYKTLPKYKYVISPEGNGIDCHRHYEALLAGCIPIVEYNSFIIHKYGNIPILYTYDYSDVNIEILNEMYKKMLHSKFDFSKLLLSYYSEEEQNLIKLRGNTWCERLTNKKWYNDV